MDPTSTEATSPATNNNPTEHIPEFMKPYFRSLRTYKALAADEEVDEKVINILGTFADIKPDPSNPPISITDAKDITIDMLRVENLIENEDYHHHTHKTITHLHRFMKAHQVDFVGAKF